MFSIYEEFIWMWFESYCYEVSNNHEVFNNDDLNSDEKVPYDEKERPFGRREDM